MFWKYSMIVIGINPDTKEEAYRLVKVSKQKAEDAFASWSDTELITPEDLRVAAEDIARDGVNRWFYENGLFHVTEGGTLTWSKTKPLDKSLTDAEIRSAYEEEMELYKIYGGD